MILIKGLCRHDVPNLDEAILADEFAVVEGMTRDAVIAKVEAQMLLGTLFENQWYVEAPPFCEDELVRMKGGRRTGKPRGQRKQRAPAPSAARRPPEQSVDGSLDRETVALVFRAAAPDNLNPSKADKIMEMGPEVVPALIHVIENPMQPGSTGGTACDQGMLAALLLSHAREGDQRAAAFLRKLANGDVQLYDHGGQRAYSLAQDFLKEDG